MIVIMKTGVHHIEGNSKEVLAELIFAIKELQKDWRKHDREDMFKRIIRDCLDAKELEMK